MKLGDPDWGFMQGGGSPCGNHSSLGTDCNSAELHMLYYKQLPKIAVALALPNLMLLQRLTALLRISTCQTSPPTTEIGHCESKFSQIAIRVGSSARGRT